MKQNDYLIWGGIAVAAFVLFSSFKSNNASINLQALTNDPGDLERLNNVYSALQNAGLTDLQIKMCMAQILVETGILTSQANYIAMDQRNNYAGLTNVGGGYAVYSTIGDFVNAYIGFLTKGTNPLGATDINDFNDRLKANSYYTDSKTTYGNNLNYYFNLLSQ